MHFALIAFVIAADPHLEPSVTVVQSVLDTFTTHAGIDGSLALSLDDNVALCVDGALFASFDAGGPRLGGHDSATTVLLRQKESLAPERAQLYQFPWILTSTLRLTPVHTSLRFDEKPIANLALDVHVGAGAAGLQLESAQQNGLVTSYVALPPTLGFLPTMTPAAVAGVGVRVSVLDNVAVRLGLDDDVIPLSVVASQVSDADATSFAMKHLWLARAGVSVSF